MFKRDEMLVKSSALLADAYLKSNKRDEAIKTVENLVQMSFDLPSGNLYKLAMYHFLVLKPSVEEFDKLLAVSGGSKAAPPEIIGNQWLDQSYRHLFNHKENVP